MTTTSVQAASLQDRERTLAPLVLAFSRDPFIRWVFTDPDQYLALFPRVTDLLGGPAFESGTADTTEDYAASALWVKPEAHGDEEALVALIQEQVRPGARASLLSVLEQLDGLRPPGPHWYLPFIGVDPGRQGKGIGSALLAAGLERVDAARMPAYLESSNERNIPLYQRHGFEVVGRVEAGDAPAMWPMVRPAR